MERWTISLERFRRLAIVTTSGICLVVVAGGVVRLTGSGLGCDDWPSCNSTRFIDVSSGHTAIEQLNRILSAALGIPTILLAIASFRVRPDNDAVLSVRGVRGPAIGVLVTVLANGVIGGLAVRGDLHPAIVQSHFLLAMASISFGVVAVHRATFWAAEVETRTATRAATRKVAERATLPHGTRLLGGCLGGGTLLALVTGTVVTGTGPHAGDENIRRFGFDISDVARLHSLTVITTIALALALAWLIRRDAVAQGLVRPALSAWMFVGLVQGGLGYVQYFNAVPELLVGAHIAFATALWVIMMWLIERLNLIGGSKHREQISVPAPRPA